ncbi:hypothetical protein E2E30_12715 [Sphingomonas sp. AAP5]|uniref:Uncharacterized protein n=1 Tax=Sphingomonas glacialis TaxID=658225 RepID=A0ABQ3LY89_9SPHN|nr:MULTISPECIES: hypothetical protein [Sphingomonas]QBM76541.1 hypothetical protein E2E30_12715 [Sphingomonas sp. AAP5]GHH26626.1 hypothetical protein GCM10008023_41500 [Sphingomonas glacialis]
MRIDQLHPTPTAAQPLEIPPKLLPSVERHQGHLKALIASMRTAGIEGDAIDASVRVLIDSYADELTAAIHSMIQEERHV